MTRLLLAIAFAVAQAAVPPPAPADKMPEGLLPLTVWAEKIEMTTISLPMAMKHSDFELIVDGKPRPIEYFSAAEQPVTFMLLLDLSASAKDEHAAMKSAAEKLATMLKAGDRAAIGAVAGHPVIPSTFTSKPADLRQQTERVFDVKNADRYGPSPVWDAVDAAVTVLSKEKGRRAIVLWTDGRATGNTRSIAEVAEHAAAEDITVTIIAADPGVLIPQDGGAGAALVRPWAMLQKLAGYTGGALFARDMVRLPPPPPTGAVPKIVAPRPPAKPSAAAAIKPPTNLERLPQLVAELRRGYTIGFKPGAPEGIAHSVELKVKMLPYTARARRSYVH